MALSRGSRILLVCLLVIAGGGLSLEILLQPPQNTPGIISPITSKHTAKTAYLLHILFIGNSYTFFNNLPGMLVKIADSDPEDTIQFTVQSVTRGGIGLKELWEDGDAVRLIHAQHWDYVVLQEQSFWAMSPTSILQATKYARLFNQEIQKEQSRPLLFTTWARAPGSVWYTNKETDFLRNPEYMQAQFDTKTEELAQRLGAVALPIGDYWANALAAQPGIGLYISDGSHPSPVGTYLTALVFYRYFSGHKEPHISFVPPGATEQQAIYLRNLTQW